MILPRSVDLISFVSCLWHKRTSATLTPDPNIFLLLTRLLIIALFIFLRFLTFVILIFFIFLLSVVILVLGLVSIRP